MNRTAKTVLAVTLGLGTAAALVAAILATRSETPSVWLWTGLLVAAAAMEFLTLEGNEEETEHPFSLAASVHMAAAILLPVGWAALVAGAGTITGETINRRSPIRVGFNGAVATLATMAASGVFHAFATQAEFERIEWSIYPAVILMWAVYVATSFVAVESISSATTGKRWSLRRIASGAEMASYLMEGCVAVVVAALILIAPKILLFAALLLAAVFMAMQRHRALRHETRETLKALAAAVDARDPYTAQHSERVGQLSAQLADALQMPEKVVNDARWAGRLHDLGKVVVDNSILHKPGALDEDEWQLMRSHPMVSAELLSSLSLTRDLLPAIRYHHERQDGRGYFNVPGHEVPIGAAIITLADSFDAMTTDRPYRKAMEVEEALAIIERGLGTHFHPELGRAFIAMIRGEEVQPVPIVPMRADQQPRPRPTGVTVPRDEPAHARAPDA